VIPVRRLNHAVLYVRDVARSVAFYEKVFGFQVIERLDDKAAFFRTSFGDNHHDLAVFSVGPDAPSQPAGGVGLYHLAWEVDSITDLLAARDLLQEMGALVGATDHTVSKSLYGEDPDGIKFEILWSAPREVWESAGATLAPLDLEGEIARWGTDASS
jgi:catechol-2,3-dioxygenase